MDYGSDAYLGFLAIIIIFQPELRRALETLGRGNIFTRYGSRIEREQHHLIESIEKSTQYMAKRRIGGADFSGARYRHGRLY